jgi:6-phospho-beta-galactosidase
MTAQQFKPKSFDLDLTNFKLPEGFIFGVCNSPYHSEGGYNTENGPHNNWSLWEQEGYIEISGSTNRFWDDYMPHINKATETGLNTFRMGFEWGRVQPSSNPHAAPDPDWDDSAFDRYAEIVGAVYDAGMEPCITLHHFTHPAWIGPYLWDNEANVDKFMGYIEKTITEVNSRLVSAGHPAIRFYVTFNEPFNALHGPYISGGAPPGRSDEDVAAFGRATVNMLWAHAKTYDFIHDLYQTNGWRQPHVGYCIVSYSLYELDKMYLDVMRAPSLGVEQTELDSWLVARRAAFDRDFEPLARRRLTDTQLEYWNKLKNEYWQMYAGFDYSKLFDTLYRSSRSNKLDYIAIDCYDPFAIVTLADIFDKSEKEGDDTIGGDRFDWTKLAFYPDIVREHLRLHGKELTDIPLYILETTIGNNQPKFGEPESRPDGLTRAIFLKEILRESIQLIQDGIPLQGFLYWTLCDNYEWGTYTSRLGLVEYDYQNDVIKDTDAFSAPNLKIFKKLIAAMQSNDPAKIRAAFQ